MSAMIDTKTRNWQEACTHHAALGLLSWFGTGGTADYLFEPCDKEELRMFLGSIAITEPHPAIHVVGALSNVIVRDGGLGDVTIRLTSFDECLFHDESIFVGAGLRLLHFVRLCLKEERGGFEFLSGIPATFGGALRMNAGAYGQSIGDYVERIFAFDSQGVWHERSGDECHFSYRSNRIPEDWIIVAATLKSSFMRRQEIKERLASLRQKRRNTQPVKIRTGGSIFKNPSHEQKAWQLIDRAGCRTMTENDAILDEAHCNFMVNKGEATSFDLETLGTRVQQRVAAKTGVKLEWEIKRLGRLS